MANTEQSLQRDKKIEALLESIKKQKADIAKAEKPKWETNCLFKFTDSSPGINIQTVSDISELVRMFSHLRNEYRAFQEAAKELGQPTASINWQGATLEQWQSDFKTRIGKVQLTKLKKDLERSEGVLKELMSDDKKADMKLAEVEELLASKV